MFITMAWHRLPRSTNHLFRGIAQSIPPSRHALLQTSFLRLRVPPPLVRKFHATDFFSATHRSAMGRPRRDLGWRSPGRWQRWVQRFNSVPPNYLLFGILGINGAIFAAWSYVKMFQVRVLPSLASESCRDHVWLKLRARRTCSIGRPASSGSPGGSKTTLLTATKICTKAGCTLSSCTV